jgi:sigma-B regulation protein RsbU (phosphoserine phosphatase)
MFKSVTSRLIFWITATTALLFSLAAFYAYRNARDQAILDAERRAILIAEAEASQVEEVLRSAEEGTRLLASTLGHTSASNTELERVIRAFVEGNPRVYGSTIAANPRTRGLYAPYFYKGPNGTTRADLATPSYDYPAQEWYSGAASAGEPRWSEPYFDEGGGNVVMVT